MKNIGMLVVGLLIVNIYQAQIQLDYSTFSVEVTMKPPGLSYSIQK